MKFVKKHKIIFAAILTVLLFAAAGTVISVPRMNHPDQNKQDMGEGKEENYLSLGASDREITDLYAELYEMSREDVAAQRAKAKDWDETAGELGKMFFTIPENEKYRMAKDGYALEDLQEAERLSAKTGRKAMELAEAKGRASDNRKWSDIVKDSEILTTEEQLGLTGEQVQKLADRSLGKEDRVEVAILLLNGTYTFDDVMKELDAGKTVEELKKQEKN